MKSLFGLIRAINFRPGKTQVVSHLFSFVKNEKGLSSGAALIVIALLFLLPAVFITANGSTSKTMFDLHSRSRWQQQASDFSAAALTSLRSTYSCTENIRSLGLIGVDYRTLVGRSFNPRLVNSDGTLGSFVHIELSKWLKEVLLHSSVFEYPIPGQPTSAIRPGTPNTIKLNWRMDFLHNDPSVMDAIKVGFIRSEKLPIIFEIDNTGRVVRCGVTKSVKNSLMEDQICGALNGPGAQFDLNGNKCL